MNIGLLITRFLPDVANGAELQLKQVAVQLASRGHDVTVFTRRYNGSPKNEQQDGFSICRRRELPIPVVRMIWDTLPALIDIRRHRPRVDVLLCYETMNSGFIGAWAQSLLGIPAVVSIRGDTEYRLNLSLANRLLVPGVYRRAKQVLLQTPRMLDDMRREWTSANRADLYKCIESKLSVVPNGVELPDAIHSSGNKVVFVGRLIKGKGTADLVSALKKLPDAEATIVGDGPERDRLQELAQGLNIQFTGRVEPHEVAGYLSEARMLVLPSLAGDGLPNVILEAMSLGVPVISTRTAGIPDVVLDGQSGLLFEPGEVNTLTNHIRRLLDDDQLHGQMAKRSVEIARSYAWDVVTPQIERALNAAIAPSSGHR